jgi:mono/diheme cytochrome c family protein
MAIAWPSAYAEPTHQQRIAQNNYLLQCQGCHTADGSGANQTVPDFRDYLIGFLDIPGGREFLVKVPGSFNAALSEAELADVLNWIITVQLADIAPADFTPYSTVEVRRLRENAIVHVTEIRAELAALVDQKP